MRKEFPHQVRSEAMFCQHCGSVSPHTVFSREILPVREPVPFRTPLLCMCGQCGNLQMQASQEFAAFADPDAEDWFCKIPGRGRLLVGDWIYIPGRPRPGRLKAVFRVQEQENLVISYPDGSEERLARTLNKDNKDEAEMRYRLFPVQAGSARIGDALFHVHRECFGTVVGFQYGRVSKTVLQLDNGILLLLPLPDPCQIPDNITLSGQIRSTCLAAQPDLPDSVVVDAAQGMAYLRGSVSSLGMARRLCGACSEVPGLRAVVPLLSVNPSVQLSDENLEARVHDLLTRQGIPLIRGQVECKEGFLRLSGFYRKPSIPAEVQALLEEEPLRGLTLDLLHRPSEDPIDKSRCQAVNTALGRYNRLQGARIRATSLDGVVYLEGVVRSSLQKNQATLAAMIAGRNLRVENHLRVVRPLPS